MPARGGCWHPPVCPWQRNRSNHRLLSLNRQVSRQAGKVPGPAQILPGPFRVTVAQHGAKQHKDPSKPVPGCSEHHRYLTLFFLPFFPDFSSPHGPSSSPEL